MTDFWTYRPKHRIMWTHDLVHGGHAPNPQNLKALKATVFMSDTRNEYGGYITRK